MHWSGRWGYTFPYCPVDEAIRVHIDPVQNYVVAALGNTHGQKSNTRRVKFQYCFFFVIENGPAEPKGNVFYFIWKLTKEGQVNSSALGKTKVTCEQLLDPWQILTEYDAVRSGRNFLISETKYKKQKHMAEDLFYYS